MSMTRRNNWPNRNSHITGWMTLNASTHGCLTRACSFLPVRYQVCAIVVRNDTVLGCAASNRATAEGLEGLEGLEGSESICMVVITCSPLRSRARSHVHRGRGSPTRCSGDRCAAG